MGTRNLVCVVQDGEYKVAQYGQWDGYPTGQGAVICEFLQRADLSQFRERLKGVTFIDAEEVDRRWKEAGAGDSGWVTMDVSDKMKDMYPELSRDAGAEVLNFINEGKATELFNSINFAGDGLFCEWAYVVNMDSNELEIYKGFCQDALDPNERFANVEADEDSDYSPVKKFATIPFTEATPEEMIKLENSAYPSDE